MRKQNVIYTRTAVYNIHYHIVWSVKYRKKVLNEAFETYLKSCLRNIAIEKGFEVVMVEVGEQDHVHVFASAPPKLSPSYIVKMLKGISARRCFMQFPHLKKQLWGGHLWNPSYYLETIGSISEDVIKRYIQNQQKGAT